MLRILAAAAVLTAVLTPTASAEPVVLECTGTKSTTYSPGLTFTTSPQKVTVTQNYAPCAGSSTDVSSAKTGYSVDRNTSCLDVATDTRGSMVLTWSTGDTSTFTYEVTVSRPAGQIVTVKRGSITAGRFAGSTAVETATGVTPDAAKCAGAGLTGIESTTVLTIADAY